MSQKVRTINHRGWTLFLLVLLPALFAPHTRADYSQGVEALELDDYALAFKMFTQSATAGDPKSQTRLGTMYEQGLGLAKNPKRAADWYEKAADAGEPEAQTHLARLYRNGKGIPRDEKRAVYWYARAAEQGLGIAQFFLGLMYETGRGVAKDYVQAFKWLDLAATGGDEDAKIKRDRMKAVMSARQIIDGKRLSLEFRLKHPELIIAQTQAEPIYQRDETVTLSGEPISTTDATTIATIATGLSQGSETARLTRHELTRRIQEALATKGFQPGPADGLPGRKTRNAIRAYQRSIGISQNGAISDGLLAKLTEPAAEPLAVSVADSPAIPAARPQLSGVALIKAVQQALANAGFDPGPADGRMGRRTRAAISSFQGRDNMQADGKPSMALLDALETFNAKPSPTVAAAIPAPSPKPPARILKGRELVRAVQKELTRQDYEPGPIDGQMGSRTRRAIREFQGRFGLAVDGKPSMSLLGTLREQQPTLAEPSPEMSPLAQQDSGPPVKPTARELIRSVQEGLNARGYDAGPADGASGAKTRRAILRFQADQGLAPSGAASEELLQRIGNAPDKTKTSAGKPTKGLVRSIQTLLNRLGYDAGPEDGIHGNRTVSAVRAFQRDRKLIPNGIMGPGLLNQLTAAAGQ